MRAAGGIKRRLEAIRKVLMENKILLVLVIIIAAVVFFALWNSSLKASMGYAYKNSFSVECQNYDGNTGGYITIAET